MTVRRGNQDGTFYRRPNGTWCGQLMINNKRYTVYAKGIQECRTKLRDKINEVNMFSSPKIPFHVYANKFIDNQVDTKIIKQSTARMKRMAISVFTNVIGEIALNEITKDTLNEFTARMISEGKKHSTLVTYIGYILSILRNAYNEGLIEKLISSDVINKGAKLRTNRVLPTLEQAKEIIESYKDERRVLLYILLYSGIRGGEAVCLKWSDIDLYNCKVYINRGVQYINNTYIIDTPKSNRVGEYAQFSTKLQSVLLEYKQSQKWSDDDFLFNYSNGKTTLKALMYSVSSKLRKIGCKGSLHVFRHLHASILLNNGIDLKTIQGQLRHASIETTNKYLHELEEDMRTSIRNLDF